MLKRRVNQGLSHVPPTKSGTVGQGGTADGTQAGQSTLKALALQRLERDKWRDKTQKTLSHPASSSVPPVPQEMPSEYELRRLCKKVAFDYPSVTPERLQKFITESEDPDWATETNARNIARLMHDGLITFYSEVV